MGSMKFFNGLIGFLFLAVALVAQNYKAGDRAEVYSYGKWYPASVIEAGEGRWKIHYDGYGDTFDEWVGPDRIRPPGRLDAEAAAERAAKTAAAAEAAKASGAAWKVGDRVEAKSYGSWYPASVIEVRENEWKVRYDGYGSSSDEWLTADKVRALRKGSWKVGDRVEALSYGKWYPSTIVEAEESRWKVKYDGYSDSSNEWVLLDRVRAIGATTAGGSDKAGKPVEKYAFPARPAGARAGLEGAFLRVETAYFGSSLSLNNQGWFFTKNGRFSRKPAGGFDAAALATTAEARKTDGSYWIEGNKLTLAWADGSKPTVYNDFEDKGDELRWSGLGSTRVKPFRKGWRFDGEYEGGASVGGGALMSSTSITYRSDGTFRRGSVASVSSTSNGTRVSGGSQSEASGTYEFDGHTLTMTENGQTAKYTVFAFGDADAAGRPEYIYRDGTMMRRR